ncbi:hypothetical protein GCM10029976_007320 [Kribbella albertanoniae]|uniref:Uncharacterized protein n=1 Tax=Kribbella albertanoniae TaxID=1266829 RepID=A0A4R4PVW0_9ACTN|nr:hypothetical protein [Kribbella albertanoniae]TDC26621.1 hypothetical protein E1261_22105 [Kribbella albertanoniae]
MRPQRHITGASSAGARHGWLGDLVRPGGAVGFPCRGVVLGDPGVLGGPGVFVGDGVTGVLDAGAVGL